MGKHLPEAFDRWAEHVAESLHEKLSEALLKPSRTSSFMRTQSVQPSRLARSASSMQAAVTLRSAHGLAARLDRKLMLVFLYAWDDTVQVQIRWRTAASKVVARLLAGLLWRAFAKWLHEAQEAARLKSAAQRVVYNWTGKYVMDAFEAWAEAVAVSMHEKMVHEPMKTPMH
eukprot:1840481-Rhodomonas_salina.1